MGDEPPPPLDSVWLISKTINENTGLPPMASTFDENYHIAGKFPLRLFLPRLNLASGKARSMPQKSDLTGICG
jgi:hypothetical protein